MTGVALKTARLGLIDADLALAWSYQWGWVGLGISLWGLHMGVVQDLLAGLLWDRSGAGLTFMAGATFSSLTMVAILLRCERPKWGSTVRRRPPADALLTGCVCVHYVKKRGAKRL